MSKRALQPPFAGAVRAFARYNAGIRLAEKHAVNRMRYQEKPGQIAFYTALASVLVAGSAHMAWTNEFARWALTCALGILVYGIVYGASVIVSHLASARRAAGSR